MGELNYTSLPSLFVSFIQLFVWSTATVNDGDAFGKILLRPCEVFARILQPSTK
jgi:hypothetical protein